jgi:hypothetical protein
MLAAPQGFEPRYADPESAVLPLNEGAVFCEWNAEVDPHSDFIDLRRLGQSEEILTMSRWPLTPC